MRIPNLIRSWLAAAVVLTAAVACAADDIIIITDPDGDSLDFIVPWDRTAGIEYAFKHPLIQEVTYDGLLQTKREELHRTVADAMDARLPSDLPGIDGMLAYHLSMGRDVERAEEYLFRAGDEAAKAAGSSEALHFFREASKLYFDLHGEGGDPEKKALLQKRIALALYYRGQLIEWGTQHMRFL